MYERFTDRARKVMQLANQEAQRFNHEYIGTEHMLLGLIKEGSGVAAHVLKNLDVQLRKVRLEVEKIVNSGPDMSSTGKLPQTPRAKKALEFAMAEARDLLHNYVGTEHLLLGLIREQEGVAAQVLMQLGLELKQVRDTVLSLLKPGLDDFEKLSDRLGDGEIAVKNRPIPTPLLNRFGKDLTSLASDSQLECTIWDSVELDRMDQILCRKTANNIVLVSSSIALKGELVQGLAQRMAYHSVGKRLVLLEVTRMMAETGDRFPAALRALMKELRKAPGVILVIDEWQTFADDDDWRLILTRGFARAWVQFLLTVTPDQYRDEIEKDPLLGGCFQTVHCDSRAPERIHEFLRATRSRYEEHHRIQVTEEALTQAIEMAGCDVSNRDLLDASIDVIDEAGARVRLKSMTRPPDLKEIEEKIERLNTQKEEAVASQDFEKAASLRDQADKLKKMKVDLQNNWREESKETWGVVDGSSIIEAAAARPKSWWMGRCQETRIRLLRMEEFLQQRIAGQRKAIEFVSRSIRQGCANLPTSTHPIASLLFCGPPGVGKTELARSVAEFLFEDPEAVISFNMRGYREANGLYRLIGSPNESSGPASLTESVRRHPRSVVVLDQIEFAHPAILTTLNEVMESGRLIDGTGRRTDFRATVLIMTTHIGVPATADFGFARKNEESDNRKKEIARLELERENFSTELLAQFSDLIVFDRLSQSDLVDVLNLLLAPLRQRLSRQGLTLSVSEDAGRFLVEGEGAGYLDSSNYGGHAIRLAVSRLIEAPLSEWILRDGPLHPGCIHVTCREEGRLQFELRGE